MNAPPEAFSGFLRRHEIAWAFASFSPFDQKFVFGDTQSLESDNIVSQYFEDIPKLIQSLDDRILPNMVQQGSVAGLICKPTDAVIVGLLYQDGRDVVQRYWHGKKLNEELRALWVGTPE